MPALQPANYYVSSVGMCARAITSARSVRERVVGCAGYILYAFLRVIA